MTEVSELVALLSKAERGYTKILNRNFLSAGWNITREQYELLQVLWEKDNVNQQAISRLLHKDKYNVTKLLNTLQKRGYVQRKVGPKDKRSNYIVLTQKGIDSKPVLSKIEDQVHTDMTFTLSAQELKSAIWVLKKLNVE